MHQYMMTSKNGDMTFGSRFRNKNLSIKLFVQTNLQNILNITMHFESFLNVS